MKELILHYLSSKKICLITSQLLGKNHLSCLLLLSWSLTLLPQITFAQTIPNEGSPDWLWFKSTGGPDADQANSVTTDLAGNVYTVGTFSGTATFGNQTLTSAGASDIFISKHDAAGNLIWAKRAGGIGADQANKVEIDETSHIYVAGTFTETAVFGNNNLVSKGNRDLFITKYNAVGEVVWAKGEGNADNNSLVDFKVSTSGHLYIAGSFTGSIVIGNQSITAINDNVYGTFSQFIAKYNSEGSVLWAKDAGGDGGHASTITFDAAGNAYASGLFTNTVVFGNITLTQKPGETNLFIVKYNASGNAVWAKQAVSEAPAGVSRIKTDKAGNVYIVGTFDFVSIQFENTAVSASSFFNIFLAKYDAVGNLSWAQPVDGTEFSMHIAGIFPDVDGNIFIGYSIQGGGRPMSNLPELNAYFKKYDQAGNVVLEKSIYRYSPPMESDDYDQSIYASNIITDAIGRIYLSFYFQGIANLGDGNRLTSENEQNTFTAIYDIDGTLLLAEKLAVTSITEKENHTYLAGSFEGTTTLGTTTLTSNGDTDAFLAKIVYNSTPPPVSTWNQTYGGKSFERLTSVVKTSDGGYLLGGHSLSRHGGNRSQDTRGRYDFWIVKTDAAGAKLWDKRYGGSDDDYLNQIIPTQDGGYLLAGSSQSGVGGDKTTTSRGSQDFWIVKITSTGEKQWDQTYGGSGFEDLMQALQLSSGEYVLAGVSESDISAEKSQTRRGSRDYWLLKVSATGQKLWDQRYGGSKAEELSSLVVTADGGFVLGGSSLSGKTGDKSTASKGGKDYWLVRTNNQGQLLWDKGYGGNGEDKLSAISITTAGEFLLAGQSSSGMSGDKSSASRGNSDYWLLKTNEQGTKIWDKTYGGSGEEELRSLISTNENGWLLSGSSFSNTSGEKSQNNQGSSDYWVVKLNEEGEQEWDQAFGGAGEDRLRYSLQTEDGGYLLGGFSYSDQSGDKSQKSQGRSDYWLVKIPPLLATQARIAAQPEVQATTPTGNFRAYPVPARDRVTVQFALPQTQPTTVQLYNSQGAVVRTLFQGEVQANKIYELEWRPTSQHANGLYILKLQTKKGNQSLKILLNK